MQSHKTICSWRSKSKSMSLFVTTPNNSLMIEKALSELALLFGNTNKVFASFERTPNLFVPEKMSSRL
jgi:hypothetical protein